jgi:hypothetical protein
LKPSASDVHFEDLQKYFFTITNFFYGKNPTKRKITIEVSEITRRKKASDQNIRIKQP